MKNIEEQQYGVPHAFALNRDTWPHFFARWGMELGANRRKASVVIAAAYTYFEVEKQMSREEFQPYFHNLLRVMEFAYEAMFIEAALRPNNQWMVLGVGVPNPEEATLVLVRRRVEGSWFPGTKTRFDVAVVNVYTGNLVRNGERDDVARVQQWIEQTVQCLNSQEYAELRPRRDLGFDITAVVFTQDLSEVEGNNARALADKLREKFPQQRPFGYSTTPNTYADIIFLIWWEECNGQRELWYSAINLGPSPVTRDVELEVVRALAPGDAKNTIIQRYDADTRTSVPVSGSTALTSFGSTLPTFPMALISGGRWDFMTNEEIFIPCSATAPTR